MRISLFCEEREEARSDLGPERSLLDFQKVGVALVGTVLFNLRALLGRYQSVDTSSPWIQTSEKCVSIYSLTMNTCQVCFVSKKILLDSRHMFPEHAYLIHTRTIVKCFLLRNRFLIRRLFLNRNRGRSFHSSPDRGDFSPVWRVAHRGPFWGRIALKSVRGL